MPSQTITLTTDFGASDSYVGAMKGVALSIAPDVTIVDVSHHIRPQDIAHAAFVLGSVYRSFTPDTIHVAVVDPGVGTARKAVLLVTPEGRFLAPDNGLLAYVLADQAAPSPLGQGGRFMEPIAVAVPEGCSAISLTRPRYWRQPVSDTFHGRDIFAPAAAHLARGVPPEDLGEPVEQVRCLSIPSPESRGATIEGRIIFVDHFGNLVSNIRPSALPAGDIRVSVGGALITGLSKTFSEGEGLRAIIGSHGYLEFGEKNGSAASRLGAGVGSTVTVRKM